jgi:Ni/Co efflux regulator RcnB
MMFPHFLNQAKSARSTFPEVGCLHWMTKKLVVLSVLLAFCAGHAMVAQQTAAKKPAAKHRHSKGKHKPAKTSWKRKGQQGIQPERATEIQQALIREKYLTGEPTGVWDARSQAAMVKYQGDNGWQTKEIPDSRAIIKLGLGPNYSSQSLVNNPSKSAAPVTPSTTASRGASGADK